MDRDNEGWIIINRFPSHKGELVNLDYRDALIIIIANKWLKVLAAMYHRQAAYLVKENSTQQ